MTNIQKMREKVQLTQQQLADRLGVGRTTVTMWESGGSKPTAAKLPELARILSCSIDELFGEE